MRTKATGVRLGACARHLRRRLPPWKRPAVILAALWLLAGAAAGQYFGQNKVPGPLRDWRRLESAHFELYFYTEERQLAGEALKIAERAYHRLTRIYGHEVNARIPILLYGSQSEFRETRAISGLIGEGTGGVTELLKRRVLVPATGSLAEFDHVLSHELTHAFQLDMIANGSGRGAMDPLTWTPDLWVMEGLAEYLSVPGVDTQTEVWLRDAALEGELPDLEVLSWLADLRVYRFGQSVVAHVAEQFGDEMLGPWLRGMARRRSVARGTSEALGMTLEQLSEDWHAALRRRYLPEVARHAALADVGRRLTDHRRALANFYVTPAVSPDGGQVVYTADETPYADLYLASAIDGTHRQRLIGGERKETFESLRYYRTTLEWSPDGKRLALVALTGGHDRLLILDVCKRETVGSFEFGFEEMLSPTWAPGGERLAFVGLRQGHGGLYACSIDGDSLEAITGDTWAVFQPAWSPDGTRIAFVTDRQYGSLSPETRGSPWRIEVIDLGSGESTLLEGTPGKSLNPQWFPDGQHLLYLSDRTGIPNLFIRDLESGADYQLTDVTTGVVGITATAAAASLSRDGRRAVFSVYTRGGWDLIAIQDPLAAVAGRRPWEAPAVPAKSDSLLACAGSASASPESSSPPPAAGPMEERVGTADPLAPAYDQGRGYSDSTATEAEAGGPALPEGAIPGFPPGGLSASGADSTRLPRERDMGRVPGGEAELPREPIRLGEVYGETAALPDTIGFIEKDYSARLSIDYAQAGGLYASGYGAVAQTLLVFSDMLGERQLYVGADVSGSLEEGDYYLGYLNQRRRTGLLFSLYQYQAGYGYGIVPGYPEVYQKRLVRGVGAALFYPLSRFRRLEFFIDAIQEKRYEWLCQALPEEDLWRCGWKDEHVDETYVAPGAAWVFDSALFGSTGPLSGRRVRLGAGLSFGQRHAGNFEADYRVYLNIRKRYALAWRLVTAGEWGPDRQEIAFGGPYSLRGYLDRPLYGTQLAFSNLEFRFPFIDHFLIAWPLRIGIGGIRGSLFFDVGGAWDDPQDFRAVHSGKEEGSFHLEDLHASCGFRASLNVGFAILRWDLTRRTDLAGWVGKAKGEFSMGWEF